MYIAIELSDVTKIINELDVCNDLPTIDSVAILDYICGEYMLGNRSTENILAECLWGLSAVTDSDYCEPTYAKAIGKLHQLIVFMYQSLDEHRLKGHVAYRNADLRMVRNWRNLYVFELK